MISATGMIPGTPATYLHRRPHGTALLVPVTVLEAARNRVRVEAPLRDGSSKRLWVWRKELRGLERRASTRGSR